MPTITSLKPESLQPGHFEGSSLLIPQFIDPEESHKLAKVVETLRSPWGEKVSDRTYKLDLQKLTEWETGYCSFKTDGSSAIETQIMATILLLSRLWPGWRTYQVLYVGILEPREGSFGV